MIFITSGIRYMLILLGITGGLAAIAQPVLTTTVTSKRILIGEPVELVWEASLPGDGFIQWPALPDSLPHFEWLERPVTDTGFSGTGISRLRQRIRFTSFDSGSWIFPSYSFRYTPVGGDSGWQLQTDSILIDVGFAPDSTGLVRDIKPLRMLAAAGTNWYWVAGAAALILLAAVAIWWYRKRLSARVILPQRGEDPFMSAMRGLDELADWPLDNAASVQRYHQRMYDLFRQYLGHRSGLPAHNKTTGDLLVELRRGNWSSEDISSVAMALRSCDAVKFAKYLPEPAACAANRTAVVNMLLRMEETYRNQSSS